MSDVVIRAEGLGKKYIIGHQVVNERYTTLRDVIGRNARSIARSARDLLHGRQIVRGDEIEEFWALKDVNFEIKRGEVVGIIGRNGAGKSTLLKILSRITEPSAGRAEISGRVASLLEVGTGFHPELSGRENIFLNGAILGMSRTEIKRKFDEIVNFAEVEKFLDTPVKHYSSGMYVRLAFAVAAHLEPEILVVDEVLAVGDMEFQKKCLGKMNEVSKSGRTILFVSHNIGALNSICESALWLDAGRTKLVGAMGSVGNLYKMDGKRQVDILQARTFNGPLVGVKFDKLILNEAPLAAHSTILPEEELIFEMSGTANKAIPGFRFAFALLLDGQRVVSMHDGPENLPEGRFSLNISIPRYFLRPGEYTLALGGRRVSGDEWTWGDDLAVVEIVPKWGPKYDQDDAGIINLPGRVTRGIAK